MLLHIHALANFILLGLILTIQWLHYPSFRFVNSNDFIVFAKFHSRRISHLVIPLMLIELLSSIFLFDISQPLSKTSFLIYLTIMIWLSTFLLSVPIHQKLAKEKDDVQITKLVLTNWPRSILWIIKSCLLLIIYYEMGQI